MPDERDPIDDISHLDFDVEDPGLAATLDELDRPAPVPAGDPRDWQPTEDVDDGTWVLNDEDKLLQAHLDWRRHRRGRLFRLGAAIVAVALLAVSMSTLLGRLGGDDGPAPAIDQERLDPGPTSAEMATYLVSDAAVRAVDPTLTLVPGNTDGTYDNRSLDELDAGGPSSPSFGAGAGVERRWADPTGRSLLVGIYLFDGRDAAAAARSRALTVPAEPGDVAGFAIAEATPASGTWRAVRQLTRFLVIVDLRGVADPELARALVAAAATPASAVH